MGAGLLSLLAPVGHFFMTGTAAWQQFRDGELVRHLEKQVDEAFVLRQPSIALWADMNYLLFRAGRPGVLVGDNGWLFTREEFYFDRHNETALEQNLQQIQLATCDLQRRGKQVLMLPLPAKRRLYGQRVATAVVPAMEALYPRVTGAFANDGLAWINALQILEQAAPQQPVFMRTDTHWSPAGASAVAAGVAAALTLPGQHDYHTEEVAVQPYQGDLLRYLPTSTGIGPQRSEPLARYQTAPREVADDAAALLGDSMPAVALVGTSYSAMDEWHFPGFLQQQLGQDVLVFALEAKGPFQAFREFLDSPAANDPRVRYVIWEVPERALIQPMNAIVTGDNHACLDHRRESGSAVAGLGGTGR
ncbi:alginate O-acetylation protein AlgJ [Alcanivorax hongdengensis A-11-3]|uniref:Probable alginate O-acetylase AlgJ n=2 Tax=Alcanivorax hongdengensis TaxID=519051 RepID=L0WF40_9GAMM|nr:alginate O-acetylation protein AlgJ [Alcanivorax hongdengensis A-11-3]